VKVTILLVRSLDVLENPQKLDFEEARLLQVVDSPTVD
jgi:hypothetical protein